MSARAVRRLTLAAAFAPAVAAIALAAAIAATGCATTPPPKVAGAPTPVQPEPARKVRKAPIQIDRVALRQQLAAARDQQIARLRDYRLNGVFPTNRVDPDKKINVFIDPDTGALCAVANLMSLSGQGDLVRATAAQNNLIRLADVHDGPLYDWVLHSGLTKEEVVLIQEPYEPYEPMLVDAEVERLRQHFWEVEAQLYETYEASLDLAVERLANAMISAAP